MARSRIFMALALVGATLTLGACGQSMDKAKDVSAETSASAAAEAQANLKAGQDFLAQKAKEPGVVKLPSGLLYQVMSDPNPAAVKPTADDTVKVHYEGKLVDGTIFDSSYQRGVPAVFALNQVVQAWQIGIPLMHKGDTYMLYVPPELGYGAEASPDGMIPGNSVLVFKVQLLDVMGK